jgi:hypothetical protein
MENLNHGSDERSPVSSTALVSSSTNSGTPSLK